MGYDVWLRKRKQYLFTDDNCCDYHRICGTHQIEVSDGGERIATLDYIAETCDCPAFRSNKKCDHYKAYLNGKQYLNPVVFTQQMFPYMFMHNTAIRIECIFYTAGCTGDCCSIVGQVGMAMPYAASVEVLVNASDDVYNQAIENFKQEELFQIDHHTDYEIKGWYCDHPFRVIRSGPNDDYQVRWASLTSSASYWTWLKAYALHRGYRLNHTNLLRIEDNEVVKPKCLFHFLDLPYMNPIYR